MNILLRTRALSAFSDVHALSLAVPQTHILVVVYDPGELSALNVLLDRHRGPAAEVEVQLVPNLLRKCLILLLLV